MSDPNKNNTMEEDDVDEFLYGSDGSEDNYGITSKPATKKNTEEDEEIYEQYNEAIANSNSTDPTKKEPDNDDAMDEDEDEDEEEDSDDDLDIILEAEEDETTTDARPSSSQIPQGDQATDTSNSLVNIKLGGQQGNETSSGDTNTNNTTNNTTTNKSSGGVDLDAVGEYNGQPITELDVDIFEDKPWRKPGADITDYFNYGFNEVTWRAYCAKQKTMREKKTTGKPDGDMPDFMTDVPDFMKMGMMMPMMEGGMPMGMMNPMMNPMMMGMPPPPPPGGAPPMMGNMQNRPNGGDMARMNQNYGGGSGTNNPRPSRR
ncbi:Fip1 motif-domain-containing protein [Chlamydoabsidia padenii]|nr:Fip1 motif-domain-containing protein [Chlamydoabsidia padenii]